MEHSPGVATTKHRFTHAIPLLPTIDLKQARIFYEHLGFQTLHHAADYAIFQRDAIELHVWLCLDPSITGNSSCRIGVQGIHRLYQDLHAKGLLKPDASVTQKPWGSYEFEVFSPEQVVITFVEQGAGNQGESKGASQ